GNRQNVLARFDKISQGARAKNWAELIKRYVVSLRPAGAPIGRFARVLFALLTGRRPRRAVSDGSKPIRARLLEKEIIQTRKMRLNKISASARTKNGG
ncbi:hypothetical protein, partial [uncultured Rikenella sp.]|uniref:hypothetical protein n=1 Tax=uncultured Rikenella sp. TaxID=368003 RepID=UPI0026044BF2